jgi:DNA-binding response OmpR family regulator
VDNVLLVEDERLIAIAQTQAPTEAGFLVHPVRDGASALKVVSSVRVTAAIIDMGLPDVSGADVTNESNVITADRESL